MSIIPPDDREIITNTNFVTFPYSTVTAVDLIEQDEDPKNIGFILRSSKIDSGITIAPNHVLTAAHNAYNSKPQSPDPLNKGLRTTTSKNENQLHTRELPLDFNYAGDQDPDPNVTNVNFLAEYNKFPFPENDIALFTTSDAPIAAKDVIGIIAFVDPATAQGLTMLAV